MFSLRLEAVIKILADLSVCFLGVEAGDKIASVRGL